MQFGLVVTGIVLLPIAIVLSHRAIAALLLIGGLVCAASPHLWRTGIVRTDFSAFFSKPGSLAGYILVTLCLWIALTGLWSPQPGSAALALGILLPWLAACALVWWLPTLPATWLDFLMRMFAGAVVVSSVLLVSEALTSGAIRALTPPEDTSWNRHKDFVALGRGTTIAVMLIFPAGLILRQMTRSWIGFLLLIAMTAYAGFAYDILANLIALMAGVSCFLIALTFPRTVIRALTVATLLVLALTPIIAANIPADTLNSQFSGWLPVSSLQRFYVWQETGKAVASGLPLGHGADYARYLSESSATITLEGAFGPLSTVPTHPHNIFIQLWLETGLPGVILSAGGIVCAAVALTSTQLSRFGFAGIAGILAAVLVSFSVEASLWQVWRICSIVLAISVILATDPGPKSH